jgi:sialate O-acetylesterase
MKKASFLLTCIFTLSLSFSLNAQVRVAEIYTDHMVIQRDTPVKVWGWASPGEQIQIQFGSKKYSAKTDNSGKWSIELDSQKAGGPYQMKISTYKEEQVISDILIGDVWLCSGQSNMEWTVEYSKNAKAEIQQATDDQIRHFKVYKTWSKTPEEHLKSSVWEVNHPENTADFTAVGYYFARDVRKSIDVPIGLINSSWSGSRIEPWMSASSLDGFVEGGIDNYLKNKELERNQALKKVEAELAPLFKKEEFANTHSLDYDDRDWKNMRLPTLWEEAGYEDIDGVALIRKVIQLSKEEAENDIALHLGMIDDSDWTYVNGELVGSMEGQYNVPREYTVSSANLREGENVIVIRIEDTGGGGGLYGKPAQLYYESVDGKTSLTGEWKFMLEEVYPPGFFHNQLPILLYNKMIHPILDFPIKGVIWYQGESNASRADSYIYRDLFAAMIKDWRAKWNSGDFPFLWVQLANFMNPDNDPSESSWAILRESQTATLRVPNTAQAVIIDIGEADDIHPKNKQDVGYRLSLAARKIAYNEDIVYSGPVYKSSQIEEKSIIISFDHIGSGLVSMDKYGYLKGFAIAGKDKKFCWAKAMIKGTQVKVWSKKVPNPAYVRYAWGINPDDANLYNMEGLPACPFRTDK